MNKIKAIKGTYDILPEDSVTWQEIERVVRDKMEIYMYSEIRTPIFEETGLFARSIGDDTDIVGKEMYTFRDMGNRSLTLRPELTASVVRSFIEHSLDQKGLPQKLWYMGPLFRQERPQKGRQRQFHQFGVEAIGNSSPTDDVEVMMLFNDIVGILGLKNVKFTINSLGGPKSRKIYTGKLVEFLEEIQVKLCEDCKRRKDTNPLRVLDCKVPGCREVVHNSEKLPRTVDFLNPEDEYHYETVKEYLDLESVPYKEDPFLVRGLDYYTGTIFEVNYEGLGAQSAIMGGGRYDNLMKQLGGSDLPAVGFACGIERLILALRAAGTAPEKKELKVYIVNTQQKSNKAFKYLNVLRRNKISAVMGSLERSMKAQMRAAWKYKAKYALIIEPDENMVSARDMTKSEQKLMSFDEFLNLFREINTHKQ